MDPKLFLMITLCSSVIEGRVSRDSRILLRQNYGVVLENIGVMDTPQSVWHQLFVVNVGLPEVPEMHHPCAPGPKRPNRSVQFTMETATMRSNVEMETEINLKNFCPGLLSYKERHDNLLKTIKVRQQNINELLPAPRRQKRGIFDFVGKFSKSLFGTATEHDTQIIQSQIAAVTEAQQKSTNEVHFLNSALQSYMIKANKHDDLVAKAVQMNRDSIEAFDRVSQNALRRTSQTLIEWINLLHQFGNHYVFVLSDILIEVDSILSALETLLKGYLPSQFIPPDLMEKTLNHIATEVSKYGNFTLVHREVGFYYHLRDITFTRIGYQVYIKIRVPLTTMSNTFDVYQIHTVPIPMTHGRRDFTELSCDKPYVAISRDELFYVVMSKSEYDYCNGDEFKLCDQTFRMQPITVPNCATALYFGHVLKIAKLCKTHYVMPDKLQTHIVSVEPNSYLVSTSDLDWTKVCPNQTPAKIQACHFCIVSLPCLCSIKAATFYLPPSLADCDNMTSEVKVRHSVNLPALYEFYNDYEILSNITIHKTFSLPVQSDIPNIKIIDHKFKEVVQSEKTVRLSLSKIANGVKSHKVVYNDKVSKLYNDLGLMGNSVYNKISTVINIVTFVLAILAFFLAIRNYLKLMVIVGRVKAQESLQFTQAPEIPETLELDSETHTILTICIMIFCCMVLFLMILSFWILWRRNSHPIEATNNFPFNTELGIMFYGNNQAKYYPLSTSYVNISDLIVREGYPFVPPRLESGPLGLCPSLKINWSCLNVVSKASDKNLLLPSEIKLSRPDYLKLKQIFDDLHTFRIVGKQKHRYYDLYTRDSQQMVGHSELQNLRPVHTYDNKVLSVENSDEL